MSDDLPKRLRQLAKEMTEGDPKTASMLVLSAKELERLYVPDESIADDAARYRWFRDECDQDRRIEILEASEGIADLIDHHIDKGRCGL